MLLARAAATQLGVAHAEAVQPPRPLERDLARRYARATLRRVALIQAGSAAGVPLRRIGEALGTLPHDRTPTKRDWSRLSRVWRDDLDRKITELERLRDDLADCIGCGCLSLRSCRLFNPGDRLAEEGPGARKLLP